MINVRKAATSIIRPPQVYSAILHKFKITARFSFNKTRDTEIKNTLFGVTLCILALSAPTMAPAETGSFTVHFAGCTEFAGWGPVALVQAQPLVPAGYVIAGSAMGQEAIVVRATSCQGVAIGQSAAQPTELSQIGINLVAPDGTGDINNYTVIYVTNNQALVEHFQTAGLPAVFDPELAYGYTPGPMETSGELYVAASGQGLPAYFLFRTENEPPPNSQQSFLANWWFTGHGGKMKQSTSFPVISFGTAAVNPLHKQYIAARQSDRRQHSLEFFFPERSWGVSDRDDDGFLQRLES